MPWASGSMPSTYTSPTGSPATSPGGWTLVQWKPSSCPPSSGSPRQASRNPAGSNHGSASRSRRSSGVQLPCSGWEAKARAFTRSHAASSRPGRKASTWTPSGRTGRGSGSTPARSRRICSSTRDREKPCGASSSADPGRSPCPQRLSGREPASSRSRPSSVLPCPRRRKEGCTTSSASTPPSAPVSNRAYPARSVPSRTTRSPPPGGPPCWSRSSASSERGRTPSAAVAACSSSRTQATSVSIWLSVLTRPSDQLGVGLRLGSLRRGIGDLLVELVAHVPDGADQRLVLGAELGPQPPHVDVDRAGAAEVVVAPDLLQQLGPGEDPARVLGEVLQELELLERQVERLALEPAGVGALVDRQLAGPHHAGVRSGRVDGDLANGEAQPRVDLGGPGRVQQHVVHAPLRAEGGKATFGECGEDGAGHAGGLEQPAQAAGADELAPRVDQDRVDGRRVEQRADLHRSDADAVTQQAQRRQDLGRGLHRVGEEQEGGHARFVSPSSRWDCGEAAPLPVREDNRHGRDPLLGCGEGSGRCGGG